MKFRELSYASVCSGVEAATVAWEGLGWKPVWFSQFEPEHNYKSGPDFPSLVLNHHYPHVPNLGDMTKLHDNEVYNGSVFNVLVGGTPCQSFSVAGLRAGLADPRGNLALEFVRILDDKRPEWFIWENVPGVLSSYTGEAEGEEDEFWQTSDFATLLEAFTQVGYSCAWRVLDAQYFGVAQRRRRVFVVGHARDWRRAAAVLFEPESLRRDPPPGREKRKAASRDLEACPRSRNWPAEVACTLNASFATKQGQEDQHALQGAPLFVPGSIVGTLTAKGPDSLGAPEVDGGHIIPCVNNGHGSYSEGLPTLRAHGGDCGGGSDVIVPIGFNARQDPDHWEERTGPLDTDGGTQAIGYAYSKSHRDSGKVDIRFTEDRANALNTGDGCSNQSTQTIVAQIFEPRSPDGVPRIHDGVFPTLNTMGGGQREPCIAYENPIPFDSTQITHPENRSNPQPGDPTGTLSKGSHAPSVAMSYGVRKLTPRECERLQGFPDDYTLIPLPKKGKKDKWSPDGARYKAMGNSMAVPVMRWIGERIAMVDAICEGLDELPPPVPFEGDL